MIDWGWQDGADRGGDGGGIELDLDMQWIAAVVGGAPPVEREEEGNNYSGEEQIEKEKERQKLQRGSFYSGEVMWIYPHQHFN